MTSTNATQWAQAVTAEQDETYGGAAARMLETVWTSGHAAGVPVDYDADDHNGSQLTSTDGAVIEYDGIGCWRPA